MFNERATFYVMLVAIHVLPAISTASDDVYLLATALYGTTAHGHILVAGPLSTTVEDIIKDDLKSRINTKAIVKVIPILKNMPVDVNGQESVMQKLRSYSNIFKANITEVETRKMLKDLWYNVLEERNRHKKQKAKKEETTKKTFLNVTKKLESSPDSYVPNDIYYAVEKKCANWADGCDQRSQSILGLPSKIIKAPRFKIPQLKLLW